MAAVLAGCSVSELDAKIPRTVARVDVELRRVSGKWVLVSYRVVDTFE